MGENRQKFNFKRPSRLSDSGSLEAFSIFPFVSLQQGNCNTLAAMLFLSGKREEEGKETTRFFLLFLFLSFISPEEDKMNGGFAR